MACEPGISEDDVKRNCALYLVRQLSQLGLMDEHTDSVNVDESGIENRESSAVKTYPINIRYDLERKIFDMVWNLEIKPVEIVSIFFCKEEPSFLDRV